MEVRERIGLLLPSSNTTMEPEFYRMAPTGVTVHTARMLLRSVTPEGLEEMAGEAQRAARLLETAGVDVMVYGCTSGSLIKGVEWEKELISRLTEATGIQTVSTAGAVVRALKALGLKRVAVVTPYMDEINRLERVFFELHGLEVNAIRGMGLIRNQDIGNVSGERVVELVEAVVGDSEGVFISCTNLPVIALIEELEEKMRRPVVTSNQASMWAALQALGYKGLEGYGVLLREHLC